MKDTTSDLVQKLINLGDILENESKELVEFSSTMRETNICDGSLLENIVIQQKRKLSWFVTEHLLEPKTVGFWEIMNDIRSMENIFQNLSMIIAVWFIFFIIFVLFFSKQKV